MPTKQAARRGPNKKTTRGRKVDDAGEVNEVEAEGRGKKAVAAKVRGKGKAVVAEEDVNEDANGDLACQRKATKKRVTFSVGNSKGKDKVVEEEEEIEESGEEDPDEDEQADDDEEDRVNAAVDMAVKVGKSALKKKAVSKPTEVTKDRPLKPKALQIVKGKAEVGEGSKKRKGDDSSLVVGKKKKEVDGHGSPRQLFNLIAILTEAQKKDVEDIGFGGC
ncbi:uncharacterized protein LOC141647783 [Silene latifolia]|uniref:uncharacterized protein LOC141647783 n=1 Tax=Silene latifolia TaxID=37657 RepID=UPI003D7789D4